jgi:hypothetical protein
MTSKFAKTYLRGKNTSSGAQNIVNEIKQYQEKWLQHVQWMDTNRITKQALQYKPKGRRNIRTTEEKMVGPISF